MHLKKVIQKLTCQEWRLMLISVVESHCERLTWETGKDASQVSGVLANMSAQTW